VPGTDEPLLPRPIRTLPGSPALDADEGIRTSLATRVVLAATVVFGQLWALVVGLDRYLVGHTAEAWLLFGFSGLSFLVVLGLALVRPAARREEAMRGAASTQTSGLYRPALADHQELRTRHLAPPGAELPPTQR
jgi:hypothetical protein